jgi:hypothetical protein
MLHLHANKRACNEMPLYAMLFSSQASEVEAFAPLQKMGKRKAYPRS